MSSASIRTPQHRSAKSVESQQILRTLTAQAAKDGVDDWDGVVSEGNVEHPFPAAMPLHALDEIGLQLGRRVDGHVVSESVRLQLGQDRVSGRLQLL